MADRAGVVTRLRAAGCAFAEAEAQIILSAARTPAEVFTMIDRRARGEPLEHVVGWAEFCGLRIAVVPGVFVPRRRTEFLVRTAATLAAPGAVVVDLCCGSGAIGVALLAAVAGIALHASDIDSAAVACARGNIGARGAVYEGDMAQPLPAALRGHVDVLVANVPYVPTDEIPLLPGEARLHEPATALDGGVDGLDLVRRAAHVAAAWLAPDGHFLVETSERQAPKALDAVSEAGLAGMVVECDELAATVIVGARHAAFGLLKR